MRDLLDALPRRACARTAATCSTATGSSTSRARSSASAASGRARGSSSSWAATTPTRCSCRSRRPSRRSSSPFAGASRVRQPGPAGRRGPAAHAGRQRRPPGLAARRTRTSTGAGRDYYVRQLWDWKASATDRGPCAAATMAHLRRALRLDARPRPRPLGRPRRDRRLPRPRRRASTARSRLRRSATPTRTSATTRRSPPRWARRRPGRGLAAAGAHSPGQCAGARPAGATHMSRRDGARPCATRKRTYLPIACGRGHEDLDDGPGAQAPLEPAQAHDGPRGAAPAHDARRGQPR